jgi:hypothetical protein
MPARKNPACTNGFHDASTDESAVLAWWQENPSYNIGVPTGAASGFFTVDVDGHRGELAIDALEREFGRYPATIGVRGPRPGGRHIYFKMPPGLDMRGSAGQLAEGLDIRANGGYTLVPPSYFEGPDYRGHYRWDLDNARKIADAPQWLLDKIAAIGGSGNGSTPPSAWREILASGADEGTRDCTITKIAGHLLRRYIDPYVVLDLMQSWNATHCRPPLLEADVRRIVNSVAGLELRRRGRQ